MKEPERFSHNELKYVEFRGCECKAFQNLLDKHLWGNMNFLLPRKLLSSLVVNSMLVLEYGLMVIARTIGLEEELITCVIYLETD
jgi:hypothetical protein